MDTHISFYWSVFHNSTQNISFGNLSVANRGGCYNKTQLTASTSVTNWSVSNVYHNTYIFILREKWPWCTTKTYKDLVYNQNGKTSSPDLQGFILKFFIISLKVKTFFSTWSRTIKQQRTGCDLLIASLVSSIFHKLYVKYYMLGINPMTNCKGHYSERFASIHSYWIFQIFLF